MFEPSATSPCSLLFSLIRAAWSVIRIVFLSRNRSRFGAALQCEKKNNHRNTHRPPMSLISNGVRFLVVVTLSLVSLDEKRRCEL